GLTGCAMIASGMILWTTKRRKKALSNPAGLPFSFKLTEGLNIGTVVGLPAAIAVYFIANRLLPVEMASRANWEMHCLFITWLVFLLHACKHSWQNRGAVAWYQQWLMAAVLFALVPITNGLTTERGLITSIKQNDWGFAGFDLVNLGAAVLCMCIAMLVKKHRLVNAEIAPKEKQRREVVA
ncbi:MAG: hypothetical protein ACPGVL_09610, partial [Pseudoalteromonas spongiae]